MRCLYSCAPGALKLQTVSHTGVSRLKLLTPVLTVGLRILSVLYIEQSSWPLLGQIALSPLLLCQARGYKECFVLIYQARTQASV